MSEFFQRNAQILQARWPALSARIAGEDSAAVNAQLVEGLGSTLSVDGIQLSSRHDRLAEARFQAASLPDVAVLHLYGTGLGDLQDALLQRPGLQRLHVHVLNGALFALVLHLLDQSPWLSDPRVELAYAGDAAEIALPYFALPAELVLADDFNAKIRDRLISETHLTFNNTTFDAADPHLVELLDKSLPLLRADHDVAQLFGSRAGQEAFVIATGPSLQAHLPALKRVREQAQRPLFIAVDTAYKPLLGAGITPDIVVSVDHKIRLHHLPPEASADTALVYMPMLDVDTVAGWRGPRYAAYSDSALYAPVRETIPRGHLFVGGSVIHPAADLAVKMGMRRVTLFGADFAFPGNRTHTGWDDGVLGPQFSAARHWVLDGHGQRVPTQLNFRGYLIELERFIARHPQVEFFNTSRAGALIAGSRFDPEFCA
ncbi:6-hydroxymethylpterin diphosphokinase MptE-like protein [Pseudomonas sp. 148P]|uniref:6-hydroxymethylpterin diphosphokinase MptE-like protein n=1 Tax=Pseudomonas ulcerans TaxID=3115852 RepID=A0ABU7HXQ3_9PSED|nr:MULTISPECIES: 6-hydroxymethylpterin diphosphokinase MptE-like protein [unclassified Pseudomonas]MEE1920392.1 6-hydroxymethylpterin diphosphokinase MptE-like protein [Pseudomonas sp. 147P]MEE1936183.1 6-hydroxymethylpterin diphosphokinase MptE-like protein [Pseudomonas sp. 148P]